MNTVTVLLTSTHGMCSLGLNQCKSYTAHLTLEKILGYNLTGMAGDLFKKGVVAEC